LLNASPLGIFVVGQTLKTKRCASQSQTGGFGILEETCIAKIAKLPKSPELKLLS
jgi:hypothetical protein